MKYTCLHPSLAICLYKDSAEKQHLKFVKRFDLDLKQLRDKYGSENVYQLPCGQCEACRINYAEEWSVRCQLEAKYHKFVYFVTLTYSDEFLPMASHYDFKRFIEKLQGTHHQHKIAYFACKELGELSGRLHYHLILFMDYDLLLYDRTNISGFNYYHSKVIDKCWNFGIYNVAEFENSCSRYVAKYCNKNGSKIFMSRNLGKRYFEENYYQIIKDNFILYGDFGDKKRVSIPRSMFYWFKDVDCPEIIDWKNKRAVIAQIYTYSKARDLCVKYEDEVITSDRRKFEQSKQRFKERSL